MDEDWLPPISSSAQEPAALMRLAVAVALANVRRGGGPFGALVATVAGEVIALGWNDVVRTHDSTAHAEVIAIRRAQQALRTHRLDGLVLYTSCAPCIQCFGAIYWSGLALVRAAARKDDAEAIGFEEGPPMDGLWNHALAVKGVRYEGDFGRDEQALAPFRAYAEAGGVNYSRE